MSEPVCPVPGDFCWEELGTRDAAAAKAFYQALFGWSMEDHEMPDGTGCYTMIRHQGDDLAGLYQLQGPAFAGVPSHWMSYVLVADVEAAATRVRELGGAVVQGPMDVQGVGRMAVLRDPQGAMLALFQAGEHPGALQKGAVPGAIGWRELMARDPERARAFYTALFGWTAEEQEGPTGRYTEWVHQGRHIGGMLPMGDNWSEVPSHWMFYVVVPDCPATVERAASLGGQVLVPPRDIPEVGTFAVLQDPTGATFAVIRLLPNPHSGDAA